MYGYTIIVLMSSFNFIKDYNNITINILHFNRGSMDSIIVDTY